MNDPIRLLVCQPLEDCVGRGGAGGDGSEASGGDPAGGSGAGSEGAGEGTKSGKPKKKKKIPN